MCNLYNLSDKLLAVVVQVEDLRNGNSLNENGGQENDTLKRNIYCLRNANKVASTHLSLN